MKHTEQELKVRQDWVNACEFHPHDDHEVLSLVEEGARKLHGQKPVLLLDLDSTLYEVGPRSFQIVKEWLASPESRDFPKAREIVARLTPEQVGYSLRDTFTGLGLPLEEAIHEAAWKSASDFWFKRFFTHDYLQYDHAYPGAPEFVRGLHDMGAEIVYLTGRDEPGMGDGTRKMLMRDGFPWEKDRTHLLLKKSFELDDLEHKEKATEYVRDQGALVASFENEPPNVVSLSDIFPHAMHIFMDSIYSDRPARPKHGLYRIRSFKRSN